MIMVKSCSRGDMLGTFIAYIASFSYFDEVAAKSSMYHLAAG